jgi:hypothetical protein
MKQLTVAFRTSANVSKNAEPHEIKLYPNVLRQTSCQSALVSPLEQGFIPEICYKQGNSENA